MTYAVRLRREVTVTVVQTILVNVDDDDMADPEMMTDNDVLDSYVAASPYDMDDTVTDLIAAEPWSLMSDNDDKEGA